MTFCNNCGTKNEAEASFCGKCGTKLEVETPAKEQPQYQSPEQPVQQNQAPQGYQQPAQGYQQAPQGYQQGFLPGELPPRTSWLTYVIVMNWIVIILLGLVGLFVVFIFPPLGLFFLGLAALVYWLVRELSLYNNTARMISIVLTGLGILGDLSSGNFVGLILGGLIIYALTIHKETVALFAPKYTSQAIY